MADDLTNAAPAVEAPAPAPAEAPAPPAPAPSPAEPPAPAPAPAGPTSTLEAAVLGLQQAGIELDKPLPEDQVVRVGSRPEGEPGAAEDADDAKPAVATPPAPAAAPGEPPAPTPTPAPEDPLTDIPEPTEVQLKGANNDLRRHVKRVHVQNKRLKEQVQKLAPGSQQFGKLQSFMAEHELEPAGAANALRIAALMQGVVNGRINPTTVLAELDEWTQNVRALAGEVLPADVQKALDEGTIDEAHAKEITQLRVQQVIKQRRAQLDQTAADTRAAGATAGLVMSAVQAWEQAIRQRDPDYPRKAKLVETTAKSLRMERYGNGMPPSPQHATALVQEAYELVTKELSAALPAPAAVRAPLNGATSSKSSVRAEPKTMLDAVIQGLERMAT